MLIGDFMELNELKDIMAMIRSAQESALLCRQQEIEVVARSAT